MDGFYEIGYGLRLSNDTKMSPLTSPLPILGGRKVSLHSVSSADKTLFQSCSDQQTSSGKVLFKSMYITRFYNDFSTLRYGAMLQALYFRNVWIDLHAWNTVGNLLNDQDYFAQRRKWVLLQAHFMTE